MGMSNTANDESLTPRQLTPVNIDFMTPIRTQVDLKDSPNLTSFKPLNESSVTDMESSKMSELALQDISSQDNGEDCNRSSTPMPSASVADLVQQQPQQQQQ